MIKMQTTIKETKRTWLRFIWIIPLLVMLATSVMKIIKAAPLVTNFEKLNAAEWMLPFGIVQLISTILFVVPKTRRIGFFLLCSYLGGIIATRALNDINHVGIALLILLWIGMYFEDKKLFNFGK
ncbi:hypothetical protein [uncultured Aquimarina sp.]|uniref:hypothetical protein n=1 Tax=uncultured Aquimarina sp. TaxID=575652 RepID=UPI00262C1051|nr:hypothetical protein [uncultured Aquimarina sp.]